MLKLYSVVLNEWMQIIGGKILTGETEILAETIMSQ